MRLILAVVVLLTAQGAAAATRKGAEPALKPLGTPKTEKKAPPPPPAPAAAEEPIPAGGEKRVALVESAPPRGVDKRVVQKAVFVAEAELRAQGWEPIPPQTVGASYAKSNKKVPSCGDAGFCLAQIGRAVGAGYVANITMAAAGKSFTVKLTVVDSADAQIVANIAGLVAKSDETTVGDAVKRQVPRALAALQKHDAERQEALAAAARPVETKPVVVEPEKPKVEPPPEPPPAPAAPVVVAKPIKPKVSGELSGMRATSVVLMVAGAAGIGTGAVVFGWQAQAAAADFKAGKDPLVARETALSRAHTADAVMGVGAAVLLTGAVLLFMEPSSSSVALTPAPGGVGIAGTF